MAGEMPMGEFLAAWSAGVLLAIVIIKLWGAWINRK